MKIESLKELDKLMLMCKKRGVDSITIDGITFHITVDVPEMKTSYSTAAPTISTGISADTKIVTDELTEEQLMFYSARPEAFEGQNQ